jgi:hypothetical protein
MYLYLIFQRRFTGPHLSNFSRGTSVRPGLFAGALQTAIIVPVDLLKIRMQLQTATSGSPAYLGALQQLRHILNKQGISGMFSQVDILYSMILWSFFLWMQKTMYIVHRTNQQSFPMLEARLGLVCVP